MTMENPEQARKRLLGELAQAKVLWFIIGFFTAMFFFMTFGWGALCLDQ
jgi:hypothetical protein